MSTENDHQRIAEAMGALGSALLTLGHDGKLREQATLFARFRAIARLDDTHAMTDGMTQLAKDARRAAGG